MVPTRADPLPPDETCGFVFATTGPRYTVMARRAARTLRQVMPGWPVDLFTDQPVVDDVFDQIHVVERVTTRPKIEALRRSRFARTICLDADMMVLADISDVFKVLDLADIAAIQVHLRTCPPGGNDPALPAAFPQLNSGLIGLRANPTTRSLLVDWQAEMDATAAKVDQPSLRRLLFKGPARLAVLPTEYNFSLLILLEAWDHRMGAPRLLHLGQLKLPGPPDQPFDLVATVGARYAAQLRRLIAADPALGGDRKIKVPALIRRHSLSGLLRRLYHGMQRGTVRRS